MADHDFSGSLSVTGNVGIGTEPLSSTQLYVRSSAEIAQILIENSGSNLLKIAANNNEVALGSDTGTNLPLSLKTNGQSRISINSAGDVNAFHSLTVQGSLSVNGNVGIGTSTPGQKLEVVGTVRATAFEGNGSALTGIQVPDGSITSPKLAVNAINTTHLANSAVSRQKLNADVISSFLSSGGGTINGNLLVNGNLLGAVRGPSNERFRTAIGFTRPGATNWQVYQANALRLDIDTSSTGFTSVPYYFTSMGGRTRHWLAVGATTTYNTTATGFTVYVRYLDSNVTPAQANEWGWFVRWMAIGSTGI